MAIRNAVLVSTGLPRCGNTLLSRKLRICFIQYKQISHHHSIGHLKYILNTGKPFVFCYRDPKDFIPSWHLKSGIPVNILIKYADTYYDILKTGNNYLIVPFEKIISSSTDFLNAIGSFFDVDTIGVKSDLIRYANQSIKSDIRNDLVSTFPNKSKDLAKSSIVKKYHKELERLAEKANKICVV